MINLEAARRAKLSTLSQANAIQHLATHGPTRMTHLADAIGISSAALTQLADKFHDMGLATRQDHHHDRRIQMIQLTEKGHDLAAALATPEPAAA